jgi:hypothetical protein
MPFQNYLCVRVYSKQDHSLKQRQHDPHHPWLADHLYTMVFNHVFRHLFQSSILFVLIERWFLEDFWRLNDGCHWAMVVIAVIWTRVKTTAVIWRHVQATMIDTEIRIKKLLY